MDIRRCSKSVARIIRCANARLKPVLFTVYHPMGDGAALKVVKDKFALANILIWKIGCRKMQPVLKI